MLKIDRMGVLILMSHLIITLALIILYGIFAYLGQDLGTIEMILLVIVGYWFGSIGSNTIRPNAQTQINQPQKVEIKNDQVKEEGENK